jgi:2-polyprenyl-6-hydroxyphenyl methylase/3-demethylubiquinone-9 3-methyltransferase
MVAKRDIFRAFRGHGPAVRLYLGIKLRICPVRRVETYVPPQGRVVDLGCGSGLMAALFMLGSERRRVTGFDLDPKKVQAARRLKERWPTLEFHEADLIALHIPDAGAVTIVDVLYLIPFAQQEEILKRSFEALPSGGVLLLKDMDTRPRWKYAWNYAQETLAVRIVGFTLGSSFYFRSRQSYQKLLEGLGFRVEVVRLDRSYWYPHILFICRKL